MLGNRELGWECWDGKGVSEYTTKQLKDMIVAGKQKVCGLRIGDNGELVFDEAGFFTTNMMVHTHINSWKPMNEESMANVLYICIGSHKDGENVVYDCISSRWEQTTISEVDMRVYLKIGIVAGGAKLDGDQIIVASTELPKKEETAQAETKAELPKKEETAKVETKTTVAKTATTSVKTATKEKK
jgi:hypothetical protein